MRGGPSSINLEKLGREVQQAYEDMLEKWQKGPEEQVEQAILNTLNVLSSLYGGLIHV